MSNKADDTSFIENPLLLLPPLPVLFAPAPSLQTFENAAQASLDPSNASAFLDRSGNVVITFQGTTTAAQTALDLQILSGTNPSTVGGFADALRFATIVQQAARSEGILPSNIHVGGYSPGGTLASLVASRTGLAGMSFASSGVPGYQAPAVPAANFVSYVGKSDPFADHGTDTAEKDSASAATAHMDHYGTVVQLGTAADAAELAPFASAINGYSLQALEAGDTPAAAAQVGALTNEFFTLFDEHHGLNSYDAAVVPATAYGLQNTGMATMMASLSRDMPRLLADVPALLRAPGMGAPFSGFQSAFPDLASELTSVMHASGFNAALATMAADSPALAADFASPAKLATLLTAIAGDLQPATGGGSAASVRPSTGAEVTAFALAHHVA